SQVVNRSILTLFPGAGKVLEGKVMKTRGLTGACRRAPVSRECLSGWYTNRTHLISRHTAIRCESTRITTHLDELQNRAILHKSSGFPLFSDSHGFILKIHVSPVQSRPYPFQTETAVKTGFPLLFFAPAFSRVFRNCHRTAGIPASSFGLGPGAGQWNLRSCSLMGTSLMLASRRRIRPWSSNSQSSLP